MLDLTKILIDGGLITLLASTYVLAMARFNQRLFLNKGDLPEDIMAVVPPKTPKEKKLSLVVGIPLLAIIFILPAWSAVSFRSQAGGSVSFLALYLHILLVVMIFNLFDLLVLDWLVFNTLTPRFMVIPGTEGLAGYKDRMFHLRQHVRALPGVLIGALIIAGIVWLI